MPFVDSPRSCSGTNPLKILGGGWHKIRGASMGVIYALKKKRIDRSIRKDGKPSSAGQCSSISPSQSPVRTVRCASTLPPHPFFVLRESTQQFMTWAWNLGGILPWFVLWTFFFPVYVTLLVPAPSKMFPSTTFLFLSLTFFSFCSALIDSASWGVKFPSSNALPVLTLPYGSYRASSYRSESDM